MNLNSFFSQDDRARAERSRLAGDPEASERRARAAALRRQHELATAGLQRRLPFRWRAGVRKPGYQLASLFEQALPAVHIMLLEGYEQPGLSRAAGDWLCSAALDTDTGEIRYEGAPAEQWVDGTGGPAAYYEQQPTCKKCLKKAETFNG